MNVEVILSLIIVKANLIGTEKEELEKTFFEIFNLKIIKQVGEKLDQKQQLDFIEGLKKIGEEQNTEKVSQLLQQVNIDAVKAKEIIETALKQTIQENIKILDDRISAKDISEINNLIDFA